jgi:formyltetrahydrofolate-dependent phosphoribosylglycinamide formyltransferase
MIHYAYVKPGMKVMMVSNGGLLKPHKLREYVAAGLSSFVISIDAASAELHENNRGLPGVCDKIREANKEIAELGLIATASVTLSRLLDLDQLPAFLRLVGPVFLSAFPGRVLNIHPSLLPSFPGLHAPRQALEYGARIAGCTVHLVDEEMDHGPILLQAAVPVLGGDTEETLAQRILVEEHQLYPAAIRLMAEGRVEVRGRRAYLRPEDGRR